MSTDALGPQSALVVQPVPADLFFVISALATVGYQTRVADTFELAREVLLTQPPAVLVTDIRLGAYNGLHLVMRAKLARPGLVAVVTTDWPDVVLRAEAEALGATFVLKPASREELLAALGRTLFRQPGDSTPVRPPFERRQADRRAPLPESVAVERRLEVRRRDLLTFAQSDVATSG